MPENVQSTHPVRLQNGVLLHEVGDSIQQFAPILWQLVSSLDACKVGFQVWDGLGRSAFRNRAATLLQGIDHFHLNGPYNQHPIGARLEKIPGERWINIYESRTQEGFKVEVRVDVTDLMKKITSLEQENRYLAQLSATDPLTGLANRRHCNELLATEWLRAARNNEHLSVLMIDIDFFKRFNDNYGHLAGDECLQGVAEALKDSVHRAGDVVARYGGEEFIMVIPGANEEEACEAAERCMKSVARAAIPHITSPVASVITVSIGVASGRADATRSVFTLVNAADAAMYRAKSAGRDCYRLALDGDWDIGKDTPRTVPAPLGDC